MATPKKRLELLFKVNFPIEMSNEEEIRKYLESIITGIKIKSAEIFSGKGNSKAIIKSNIMDILTGNVKGEDDDSSLKKFKSANDKTPGSEMKEQAVIKLNAEIARLKNELADATKINYKDREKMFQEQIMIMSQTIEGLDNEKSKLQKINNAYIEQIEELKQKLDIQIELSTLVKEGESLSFEKIHTLLMEKEKKFKEEKANYEDQIAQQKLKIMFAEEKAEKLTKQSELGNTYKEALGNLEKENNELRVNLQIKTENLEQIIAQKVEENECLSKKFEEITNEMNKLIEHSNNYNAGEKLLKKQEEEDKIHTQVEEENFRLKKEIEEYKLQIKESKQSLYDFSNTKDINKRTQIELQKVITEKEDIIRQLKLQLKEKANRVEEMEKEYKEIESESEGKLSEAQDKINALTRQMQELEIKVKKEERTNVKNKEEEILSLKSKLKTCEFTIARNIEEIKELKKEALNSDEKYPETATISKFSSETTNDSSSKLLKQLEDCKLELARLGGRFLEKDEELNKEKENVEKLMKENYEQSKKIFELESKTKKWEDYEKIKLELNKLKAINNQLTESASEIVEALNQVSSLQKQLEFMKKQNLELKEALFQAENNPLHNESSSEKKKITVSVIEEMKQYIAEIIYVYKTLDTHAKQFKVIYEAKKEKIEKYREIFSGYNEKKNNEKIDILKQLSEEFCFIKIIQLKVENLKLLTPCLLESIKVKLNKLESYESEIIKFDQMIKITRQKLDEYEQKLNFY